MRKLLMAAGCLLALAACGQTTTPATTETPAEVAATTTAGPMTQAEATAQDSCGAAAFRQLVGGPASTIDLGSLPPGTRMIGPETMVTQDFVATRLNIMVGTDGNVGSLACY